jgi:hypothetical protein
LTLSSAEAAEDSSGEGRLCRVDFSVSRTANRKASGPGQGNRQHSLGADAEGEESVGEESGEEEGRGTVEGLTLTRPSSKVVEKVEWSDWDVGKSKAVEELKTSEFSSLSWRRV